MLKQLLFVFAVLTSITVYGQDTPVTMDDPLTTDAPLSTETPESPYPWSFGLKVGAASMGGDLVDKDIIILNQPRLGAGVFLRRALGDALALRLDLMYFSLRAEDENSDDAGRRSRGFTSQTTIIEPSLSIELAPFAGGRFTDDYTFRPGLSPYVMAGVGYGIWGDVTTEYNELGNPPSTQELALINTDKSDQADDGGGIVFPLGVGLRYHLSPKSALGVEYSFRITGSDLIDGVSASGDPDDDDTYAFLGLTYTAGFGSRDADGDGINDEDDECPTQPGPANTNGCPDADGDGVADKDDECPNEAGVANLNGCPDGDSDGVADKDDDCPTEPGTAATNGCPDGDGDGVADKDDECPDEAGLASLNGCPDGDGDGIADKDDECPAEAGPAATNGCPDRDGDGIADKDDECPDEAGVAERNGCPLPNDRPENLQERTTRYGQILEGQDFSHIRIDSINGTIMIDRIFFPTDASSLNRPDRLIIEEIDRFLSLPGAEDFKIRYEGHADRRASDEYNMNLSQRRANSASEYSERQGADPANLSTIGFGENQPVGATLRENRVVIPVATEATRMIDLRN
ncbi:Peptidoglycan-associated lipoprotein [Neolewinella maritima]|uniref:Peptidoglycan-associated lipoprotein n=1 Tax=Neolewinella maritima TaxID=1383882 RepID=A0ABN8F1G8_9BACT|nr:DUF6089 family protein [Neolewinella maritima]CAH1000589.1 Peptidoglycan-associated lipoprotein [Neolewinella maritima]